MHGSSRARAILATTPALLLWLACAAAPAPPAPPVPPLAPAPPPAALPAADAAIPLDPAVTVGRLANGLTYYVRANGKPENRASLRLAVDVGSLVEDDDQLGLAHFVEHMAFNGTERFAKQELVSYLERIGMRFGADVNAYTSFDETVYMLEVPTDDEETLATGLDILAEWAHRVSFEDEEIELERGVVVEEWRLGRGARARIADAQLPVLFHGSRYAERKTIGEKEVLEQAPPEALRRFYRDWYRPDLMAVVAVGDFDEAGVIATIERLFGELRGPDEPRPRIEYEIPGHRETLTSIVTDPEATAIDVMVGYKRPAEKVDDVAALRRRLIDAMYDDMMIARLGELSLRPDPPYQGAYAASGPLGRTRSVYQLAARVRDGGVLRGLETLLAEARRVETWGFTASELERTKTGILRGIERAWEERDKGESNRYAGGYVRHFLADDPEPGIDYLRDLYADLVPGVALAEVNARAQQWLTDEDRVILVSGPDKEEAGIPSAEDLLATFDRVAGLGVTPWVDRTRDEPLVASPPPPGAVVSEEEISAVGALRWRLSNGVTMVLKPTDFKNDEVLLAGYSPGGHSLVPEEDYITAIQAASVVAEMGLGDFDQIELGKKLTGKVVGVGASIGEISEEVDGAASPRDLETLFQLLYLEFTGARRDEEAFQSYLATTRGALENQEASPGFWFEREWNQATFGGHPRRRLLTLEAMDELDLDRALAIYRERFADASEWIFTLVGSFDPEAVRPLVEAWVAALPATGRAETWRDVDAWARPTVSRFEVRRGIEPRASVRLVFHGFTEWSPLAGHLASSMAEALRIRLREVMREDLGGVYGVRVYSSISRYPRGRYNSGLSFGCDPERTDELLATALAEIEKLKDEGPSQDTVDRVREIQRRGRETALERNGFWLSQLEFHEVNGLPLTDILDYETLVEAVTVDSIRDAARLYFDSSRYVQGVLRPGEPAAGEGEGESEQVEARPAPPPAPDPAASPAGRAASAAAL
ncbi:MAG: insulinase family protein [Acidobacteriota bacterium]|nr:insulinase family protein [Acidobacteriota bacterium]